MTQAITAQAAGPALAGWTRGLRRSALQEMLSRASGPGILSFALGLPSAELFPVADYARAVARVLAEDPRALQYGPPERRLKTHVAALMAGRGVNCTEEQIFITAGAQQGLTLLARLLLDQGGQVLCEETIYPGFQQAVEPFEPELLTVPTDAATGIDVDAVEALLRGGARPAFIYVISSGHNPLAVTLGEEKRRRLVELARRYRTPIVEDDPYGMLSYEEVPPPLRAFEDDWVFYVGSFSKILAPSLRVGWVVVPEPLTVKLSVIKEASDIDTATLAQRGVCAYLDEGRLPAHVEGLRREYKLRRDTMLRALEERLPAGARWQAPSCGLFIWVELPEGFDADAAFQLAVEEERLAFIPGGAFGVNGSRSAVNCLRLNFSNSTPELIEEGVARLARVLGKARRTDGRQQ